MAADRDGIPKSPLSYVHVVREDPVRRGLLYAGTENGLYVSFNDGERWQPLQNNLPHAPVYWIEVQPRFNDLVIATYGRGFWILDDITPLRTLHAEVAAKPAHLFAPRDAYRFRSAEAPFADYDDPNNGTNPQYGASLHFLLKEAAKDSVTLTFTNGAGQVVRTMRAAGKAGMNRVYWDLQTDQTRAALLRTPNPYAPETRYPAEGGKAPQVNRMSQLVLPGTYTVTLRAAGQLMTQPLVVRRDPTSGASDAEIVAQAAASAALATDANAAVDMLNSLESVRAQVQAFRATLAADSTVADLRAQADTIDKRLLAVEEQLVQVQTTGRGQDQIRRPFKLIEQLEYLAQSLGSSDYGPTDAHMQVQAVLRERLQQVKTQFDAVMGADLTAFRQLVRSRNTQGTVIF
ncbi:MAG: hypothetical protein U5K74_07550 [Gemmatimonadaceae bacterium]|nr:hypothetical protein [Gemmatimonadaceae bacterium]